MQLLQLDCERGFVSVGGQCQQADDGLACLTFGKLRAEVFPGLPIDRAREDVVAKHPPGKGSRLALEVLDKMTVVNLSRMAIPIAANSSRALEHGLTAQKASDPISVHAHVQPMTDESAWRAVLFPF